MCTHWTKCKYPFFGDIKQFLSNMNPSKHRALLSRGGDVHLTQDRNCKLQLNIRALDYSTAYISTRYSKFPVS